MQQKPLKTVILIAFIGFFSLSGAWGQEMPVVCARQYEARCLPVLPLQPALPADSWFGRDKVLHFTFSMFLYTGSYAVQKDAMGVKKPAVYSAGFTFSIGLGKEIFDRSRPPNFFSWKDMLWNCAGIGAGLVLMKTADK